MQPSQPDALSVDSLGSGLVTIKMPQSFQEPGGHGGNFFGRSCV